jgi:biotin carboxylase
VPRILLLLPTATYRARDFVQAAAHVGAEVVVGSEAAQTLAAGMGDRAVVVPLDRLDDAVAAIEELHRRAPIDAVVAVDDPGLLVATAVAEKLGFRHNPLAAVAATRDKAAMRRALARAGVPQPRFAVARGVDDATSSARDLGFPVVVKPVGLSASRGVIRADDALAARAAARRALDVCDGHGPLLVEEYVPGVEVALEGILHDGTLETLAVFDKPDPLEGPYFEETIYVTPSRLARAVQDRVRALAAAAAAALGLTEGPVHAEVRIDADRAWVIEIAARSIGGLCSRALRFGAGISLEEVIVRHALDLPLDGVAREPAASGVMMLPIPAAGVLRGVDGQDAARAVAGITGLEITTPPGRTVVPLPEGDRYLGFLFARGERPADVEHALRTAHGMLDVVIDA